MSKRITVVMNDDLDKKIRLYQVKIMQRTNSSYSYSAAINDTIRKALK